MVSPYSNPSTKRGATMNTTFIVDKRSRTLQDLWESGILIPRERLIRQGQEPFAFTTTVYEAAFTDRNRSLLITPETYDVMTGTKESEGYIPNELDEEELRAVQSPNLPAKQEAKETYWVTKDGANVVPDPVSLYDLGPEDEEIVEEG